MSKKNPTIGQYSILQCCPGEGRKETVNIGILLFVKTEMFLKIKINKSNKRIEKFFGDDYEIDYDFINTCKHALKYKIKMEHAAGKLNNEKSLQRFLNQFCNEYIFVELSPVQVDKSPKKILKELYKDLVLPPKKA